MRRIGLAGFIFMFLGLPGLSLGAEVDGSKPLICAILETVQCLPGQECLRGHAENVGLPYFFQIDFQGKRIFTVREGREEETKIERVEQQGGIWILQGIELRGWTITISGVTGKMVLSAAGEAEGFILFGACTQK